MKELIKKANWVFVIGNGGSASTAEHFVNDLVKACGIKAMALSSNSAVMTAYADDCGYETVYANQLKVFAEPGDLLIAISTSGKSDNVLLGIITAKAIGMDVYDFPHYEGIDIETAEDRHMKLAHDTIKELKCELQSTTTE